jgi:6,7-dimethyl-8-ribityllumazine synthase
MTPARSVAHEVDPVAKLPSPQATAQERSGARLAIVTAEFNSHITDAMREDALRAAKELGAKVLVDVRVPGVFDIPLVLGRALLRKDVDAAVALGAVITGETRHDEVVAFECAHQLADLAVRSGKPVGLGVTGPGQTEAQAKARIDRAAFAVRSVCSQFKTLRLLQKRDAGTA